MALRLKRRRSPGRQSVWERAITVRPARPADASALLRVAERDSRPLPAEPLLVAECESELVAAISLGDGAVVADPFRPTAEIVELLRFHARGRAPVPITTPAADSPTTGRLGLAGGCA